MPEKRINLALAFRCSVEQNVLGKKGVQSWSFSQNDRSGAYWAKSTRISVNLDVLCPPCREGMSMDSLGFSERGRAPIGSDPRMRIVGLGQREPQVRLPLARTGGS
jgi:hypothetical protein